MSGPKDGGPAFPVMWDFAENETGMTLRDYFAIAVRQAMGMWTPHVPPFDENDQPVNRTMGELETAQRRARAAWAYAEADAMLAAREAKS